jgi:RNA polymerase sigma factor (sigma-70 family)
VAEEEDLVQETLIRLLLLYRRKPTAPAPYIRTLIANRLRTAVRREAGTSYTLTTLAEEVTCRQGARHPDLWYVTAWAANLPKQLRAIYLHLYVNESTQRETARAMNISQPRVAQLHRMLLERARTMVATQHNPPQPSSAPSLYPQPELTTSETHC